MNDTRIIPLSEGAFTIGHDKVFVPFDTATDNLIDRPPGSLLVEIQPFLLINRDDIILLDTGLGFEENGVLQIHQNIRKAGIDPAKVNKVILSHLHKDHSGGISQKNSDGLTRRTSFPDATYYINSNEFNYAFEKGTPSYDVDDFRILTENNQVSWFKGTGELFSGMFFEESGGHCPHHTTFLFSNGKQKFFFGGDVAPQLKQLKVRYQARYDYDGKRSMELREEFVKRGKEEHWTFLFYHDVNVPTASL